MNRYGKRCVLYPRVSTEMQVDGYSLEGQKNMLTRFADREEMIVVDTYEDAGKSGKSIEGRPAFQKMLRDIEDGLDIDYILVYKLSRFGRNAADILNSLELVQSYGVNLICIEEGIDSSQTSGKLLISVLSAVAEIERENIIEQTMNGRREKARQGGWNGGFAPYGYTLEDNKLMIEETEAVAIRKIFELYTSSEIGLGGIANQLNLQGIRKIPRQNGTLEDWTGHFIKLILDNPVYCGKIAYGRRTKEKVKGTKNDYQMKRNDDYILTEGQHKGIVSEEVWEKAHAKRLRTGVKQPSKIGRDRVHLLSGLLKCPVCGSPMYTNKHAWTNKDGTYKEIYYYVCSRNRMVRGKHCEYKAMLKKTDIEPMVIEAIREIVRNEEYAQAIKKRIGVQIDTKAVDKELEGYQAKLKEVDLNKTRLEREIDSLPADAKYRERKLHDMTLRLDSLYDVIVELEEKIEDARLRRDAIKQQAITLENIYKIMVNFDCVYNIINDEEKRNVVTALIKEIEIYRNDESEYPLKRIGLNFPVFKDGGEVTELLWDKGNTVETDTVTVNLIPSEKHTANYNVGTKTVVTKVGGGAQSFDISVPKAFTVKVTAPAGSTVSVGTFGNYYTYEFLRPQEDSTATKDGDTVTVTYRAPETNLNHFVRVQNPDGVTYWDFNKWTTDQDIVVTRADLHMDDDFNKDTVSRFDKNTYDLGNVYLNINAKGYMNMNAGDTYELDVFRNWQAIEGFVNAKIALPDAHYEVVDFDGKPSDVVSIAPNADNSCLAYMTANHQGTALVKVTYDAMTHKQGQSSTADKTFSAIWPEFTGVFVVSVGADGTAIQTNMLMDRMDVGVTKDEQKQLDAEHDILFYLGTDGASYTFTPESGCTVTVARSTVGKTMTFNGFTSEGVTVDAETGAVTVANLTTGRHIVRVEKDGVATYQVITARGVSYKLLDAEGNELPENAEVKPGETVQLQFTGLVSPKEKMAGVYNHRFSLYYTDADGNFFQSNPGGYYGVYDFSGNPARQRISITVPADQEGLTYELTGAIKVGGYPGKPTHRIVTYAEGMGMQHGTATASVLAQLPQVTLKLSGYAADGVEKLIDAIGTVTLDSEETIKAARDAYDALTEEQKAQVGNYQTLLDAEVKLADLQAVDAVEKLIDAIGTVTLDSEEAIKAARGAYDALTEEQKAQVGNYQTLLDAEAKLADLQAADAVEKLIDAIGTVTLDSEEAIKAARGAYDALTDAQKEQVGNYQTLLDAEAKLADLKAADAVEKLIDAIGTVTLDSEEAIKTARGAYDALTDAQKEQVGNYQTLLDAEAKLADLKAVDAVEKLIDAIGTVTLDSEEAIKAARGAYDALTDAQKELVGNYQTLLDAEAKLAQLKKDAEKPSQPEQPEKPATGDAGVALWLTVMCMTTLLGAALVSKKRKA